MKLLALKDLLSRYLTVWRAAWDIRAQLAPIPRKQEELAFLPAHLELQDTPVSPAPRYAIRLILLFAALVLLWAIFGKIDIVAVARGKVVPNDRVKTLQPLEASVVKRINVVDGQRVKAGQVLIELDATLAGADDQKAREAYKTAKLTVARSQALIDAIDHGKAPQLPLVPAASAAELQVEQTFLISQYQEYRTKLSALDAELGKRSAELATVRRVIAQLKQALPIAQQREKDYQALLDKNFVSKHGFLDREQDRMDKERELSTQEGRAGELNAAIFEVQQQRLSLTASMRRSTLDQLGQAQVQVEQLAQETLKTGQRDKLTRLTAPVDGVVQQLAIHTVGGVVTPAQALLVVVPEGSAVEIEAWIENKDIGFVRQGQEVTVKVDAFPYTKYGYVTGRLATLSSDAVNDEKRGPIYQSRIHMQASKLKVEDKWMNLSPGMAVTVEVKTGQRRLIEYFLSPLITYSSESLHER